jgi:hypothetical protein
VEILFPEKIVKPFYRLKENIGILDIQAHPLS